jgi:hypothetical protein
LELSKYLVSHEFQVHVMRTARETQVLQDSTDFSCYVNLFPLDGSSYDKNVPNPLKRISTNKQREARKKRQF